ncbi:MAG: lipoate--protein ligase [Thermoprotei archaeon]
MKLGGVDGYTMTNTFVVLADSVSKGARGDVLVVCHPSKPFANVGFHQDASAELDLDYCRANDIPVVRRVIGGGAIADGPWEQDYFYITRLGSPLTYGTISDYYGRMLEPVRRVLEHLGVKAARQGLNDLAVEGRKISANGAVDIEGARVLTGDILLSLDVDVMSGILRVPDAKFRDKMADSMRTYLTSVQREVGVQPERSRVEDLIVQEFSEAYGGEVSRSSLTSDELGFLENLISERKKPEWIYSKDSHARKMHETAARRTVKIKEGMFLFAADYKAQKLIRVTLLVDSDRIVDASFSGDFFTVPVTWTLTNLENSLKGVKADYQSVKAALADELNRSGVTVIGATVDDFANAVLEATAHPVAVGAR